jgi:putative phosphoesterase
VNGVRLAIVSDVHGNLVALEAVARDLDRIRPDRVVHGGDLALSGPRPAEVIDCIRELGWPGVVGNTDELLWRPEELASQERSAPRLRPLLQLLFNSYAPATRGLLGAERIEWLRALPPEWRSEDLLLVHASPGDLWRAPPADASDRELLSTYGDADARLVVYGHIHRAFIRRVGTELTVANSGSVGMPRDGDPRASYLLVEDGAASVHRVTYDVERHVAELSASGYPDAERLALIAREGRYVPPETGGGQR